MFSFLIGQEITIKNNQGEFAGKICWLPSNGAIHFENDVHDIRITKENILDIIDGIYVIKNDMIQTTYSIKNREIIWLISGLAKAKNLSKTHKLETIAAMLEFNGHHHYDTVKTMAILNYMEENV